MPYVLIISFFFVLGIVQINKVSIKRKNIYLSIAFLFLVLQDGLRWNMGTDWLPYYENFMDFVKWGESSSNNEFLYQTMVKLVSSIFHHYTAFLLIEAAIMYYFYIKWIKEYI